MSRQSVFGPAFVESGRLLLVVILGVPALLIVRVLTAWNARSGLPQRNSLAVTVAAVAFVAAAIPVGRMLGVRAAALTFVGTVWLHAALLLVLHRRRRGT